MDKDMLIRLLGLNLGIAAANIAVFSPGLLDVDIIGAECIGDCLWQRISRLERLRIALRQLQAPFCAGEGHTNRR